MAVTRRRLILIASAVLLLLPSTLIYLGWPGPDWPDRRPIGELFLADHSHASPINPRGWFSRPELDIAGPGGHERFRAVLLQYAEQSIAVLQRTGCQGVIVWDLEGEEFPQKTTYLGDPRLLKRLAPEMNAAADDFFRRFQQAGLRVGLTVRPQQLVFNAVGRPTQTNVEDYEHILLEKISYARKRWGATLFYIDSNGGILWPAEPFRLRRIARLTQGALLIPEHHDALYYGFSAPYVLMRSNHSLPEGLLHLLYPRSFKALSLADIRHAENEIAAAQQGGDVLLFPAMSCGPECQQLEAVHNTSTLK